MMNLFKKDNRLRRTVDLKKIDGEKIREQYFNVIICLEIFCVLIPVAILLTLSTLMDGIGTKFNDASDILEFVSVALKLLVPFIILSVLNRFVFGEIICVLDDIGIHYSGGFIRWDAIDDIVYVINGPNRYSFKYDSGMSYARVLGNNLDIKIYSAPVFLLFRARKYNKNIKVRYSKGSIAILVIFAVLPSLFMIIMFLKDF